MALTARTIGVRELKAHTSEVLREVHTRAAEFVITLRGRPIARLEPLLVEESADPEDGMGGLRGALSELPTLEWGDFRAAKELWEPRQLGGN